MIDKPVPASVANLPLTDNEGRTTTLAALRGDIVVLADFMTLCQETCPLTTGNLLEMDRAVTQAGLGDHVRFVELTVDPARDTPSRLAAYRTLVGAPANWSLLTGSPDALNSLWKYFGVWYQRVAEDSPPGVDWLTGRPLTYDINHEDAVIYLDASRPRALPRGGGAQRDGVADRPGAAPVPEQCRGAPIWPILTRAPGPPGKVSAPLPGWPGSRFIPSRGEGIGWLAGGDAGPMRGRGPLRGTPAQAVAARSAGGRGEAGRRSQPGPDRSPRRSGRGPPSGAPQAPRTGTSRVTGRHGRSRR